MRFMNRTTIDSLRRKAQDESYGRLLGMEIVEVGNGFARVRMRANAEFENIFGYIHGGALFSLIDEAFQLACNSHGSVAVALNVSITYMTAAKPGATLEAQAKETHRTRKTASYICELRNTDTGELIATAQALAYRTGREIPA
jgi:acyl-CoA thioesterase